MRTQDLFLTTFIYNIAALIILSMLHITFLYVFIL